MNDPEIKQTARERTNYFCTYFSWDYGLNRLDFRPSFVSGLSSSSKRDGWTREREAMSMTKIHNLIHTFAVLFFKIMFFRPFLFHIITAEERSMRGHCVLRKSVFPEQRLVIDLRD